MKWIPILFLLILAVALGLRLPQLANRPMHHDEANQAYRFGLLLEEGTYQYDADDHHGPTLYYLTLTIAWLTGSKTFAETHESTYRIVPVFFGLLLILCTPLLRRGIGGIAVLSAALLTAISPAMVYYSRFYIQEMLLVFFTFLAIAAGWLAWRSRALFWTVVCGLSLGLMFATKETAVLAYAAMVGAILPSPLLQTRNASGAPARSATKPSLPKIVAIAWGCAIAIAFTLFSSFFTHLDGPLQSILAFKGYLARGVGVDTAHVHPWNFYLAMLLRPEGLIFGLGWIGIISILSGKLPPHCNRGLARFLMFYTVLLTLAYSALAYKTPWCLLSFLHGWILLAGIGAAALFNAAQRSRNLRLFLIPLLLVGVVLTTKQTHRLVFRQAADPRNPYAYVQTSPDFKKLMARIGDLEAVCPAGRGMQIQVIAPPDSTWPLPFYLRHFTNMGYWVDIATVPAQSRPDLIISPVEFKTDPTEFLSEYYALRPDTLLALHIRLTLWNRFMESRTP